MKIQYQCEQCFQLYDSPEEAISCEQQAVPPPIFTVGETIYIKERYPVDKSKPFVKRTILAHFVDNHKNCYYLNEWVNISKHLYLCKIDKWGGYPGDRPLVDKDYQIYAFRLGDVVDLRFEHPQNCIMGLTLDLVSYE